MRRIAHYASITVENRIEWQRRMIRTRLVDEELKDLFTNGLPTPDGGSFGEVGILDTSKLLLSPYCFELRMSLVQQYWPGFSNFTTINDIMWC